MMPLLPGPAMVDIPADRLDCAPCGRRRTPVRQLLAGLAAGALLALALPAAADHPRQSLLDHSIGPSPARGLGKGESDYGGVGLMQLPNARFRDPGTLSVGWNRVRPYRRYTVFMTATDWLEGGFRYTELLDNEWDLAGGDPVLDKGFDAKVRLWRESRYLPQVAFGLRDFGGNAKFGSEFFVASKRWHDLDFTLGLGWGRLGRAADVNSPLGWLYGGFDDRERAAGGEFGYKQLFSGPMAVFAGVEWQTPWDPLILQVEFDGNDFSDEPSDEPVDQDSRFNFGARLAVTDNLELRGGWQRGNTAQIGVSFALNLGGMSQVKQDPRPADTSADPRDDWPTVVRELEHNAGVRVERIDHDGRVLRVTGEPLRYRALPQSEGRAGRILHADAPDSVEEFRFRWTSRGLALRESVHDRQALVDAVASAELEPAHQQRLYSHGRVERDSGETLFQADAQRFEWGLRPRLDQNFGGPDGYLYRIVALLEGSWQTDRNGWFSGALSYTALDNLDNYSFRGESELPRVRTFVGDYLSEADLGIEVLQYTRTAKLGQNWYGMAYAGLFEMMFGGAGGELLYRPFNSPVALGLDVNWVRQREFDQRLEFRDYDVWTGHLTAYVDTGIEDIQLQVSGGRYLAGDWGTTLSASREFDSGVVVGAWGTWTDAGSDFGEGSFDKGLYLSLPMDIFFTRSSRQRGTVAWAPLTRDGGARLARRYSLFSITGERRLGRYWEQYPKTFD